VLRVGNLDNADQRIVEDLNQVTRGAQSSNMKRLLVRLVKSPMLRRAHGTHAERVWRSNVSCGVGGQTTGLCTRRTVLCHGSRPVEPHVQAGFRRGAGHGTHVGEHGLEGAGGALHVFCLWGYCGATAVAALLQVHRGDAEARGRPAQRPRAPHRQRRRGASPTPPPAAGCDDFCDSKQPDESIWHTAQRRRLSHGGGEGLRRWRFCTGRRARRAS
jgi:hypothetical protein